MIEKKMNLHACATIFQAPLAQNVALTGAATLSDAAAYRIGVENKKN